MADEGDATVHLQLRGEISDDDVSALRQQLVACLASGVIDIRVHLDEQADVELRVLQALQGAGDYLRSLGGSLSVVGAQPRVVSKLHIHGLERLLPPEEPVATVPGTRASGHPAPRRPEDDRTAPAGSVRGRSTVR